MDVQGLKKVPTYCNLSKVYTFTSVIIPSLILSYLNGVVYGNYSDPVRGNFYAPNVLFFNIK